MRNDPQRLRFEIDARDGDARAGVIHTAHSLNPVPLLVTVPGLNLRDGGILADVAPTVLALLGIEQPAAMTGTSLLA